MGHDIEANKRVVRAFAEAVNRRDSNAIDQLVALDFVRHSNPAPGVRSRDDLKRYLRDEFAIFPDAEECVEDVVAEADRVAVRHSVRPHLIPGSALSRSAPPRSIAARNASGSAATRSASDPQTCRCRDRSWVGSAFPSQPPPRSDESRSTRSGRHA